MINMYTPNTITSDILLYSISDYTVLKVSSLMTTSAGALALQGNEKKYYYYFGGNNACTVAPRFNTDEINNNTANSTSVSDFVR
jgi:hypothetical protein